MNLPNEFTISWGRELIAHLGGDPTPIRDNWCWKQFGEQYPELRPRVEKFIEDSTEGDIAWAAYWMCMSCGSSREWAEAQIERGIGGVTTAAQSMCMFCGSSREWAEKQRMKK